MSDCAGRQVKTLWKLFLQFWEEDGWSVCVTSTTEKNQGVRVRTQSRSHYGGKMLIFCGISAYPPGWVHKIQFHQDNSGPCYPIHLYTDDAAEWFPFIHWLQIKASPPRLPKPVAAAPTMTSSPSGPRPCLTLSRRAALSTLVLCGALSLFHFFFFPESLSPSYVSYNLFTMLIV